ncbi:Predicted nucleotide-binding protein, sugar kinase/HSP70/actin superfamily [Desulfofundulus australicus DSM 11792]|uniref:Predicted nucleotide-binding protein, sugar kinase/HSP70/actin superfamily n=1 Tax=Desulfofundulus australicus DSM 11792 TaxID=1121425 RepID=A0A1M5D368_9FIRM|nr:CoA protein activase [Desulfofundulus australicus]SHF61335.1 Predicted nucleotide-binding protein, sugar kinase/HSP70/actin superfamily [Desulfofundulus australicus DSM 11792]
MPRITFPHVGESYRSFKMLMEDLGNEVILPPRPSKRTLDLGVRYAPEFACFPVKILLGTYLETCPQGVELIITSGGVGPCRAGHYAQLHKKILRSLGYQVDIVVFEPPRLYPLEFLHNIQRLNPHRMSYRAIYECIRRAWRKLQALDNVEKLTHKIRPRETVRGATTRAYRRVLEWIDRAYSLAEIEEAEQSAIEELKKVPQDPYRDVLRVGIVGEVYVLLEPASNLEIEETLGNLGVEVERSLFLTGWTRDNTWAETTEGLTVKEAALPYLPELLGGHGRDSIGNTVLYAKRGFDGVIQLAPFTCIPEIVARTILPRVSEDHSIPVLTFFLDEQTGKAGMATRLEAFVDLMRRKKAARRTA